MFRPMRVVATCMSNQQGPHEWAKWRHEDKVGHAKETTGLKELYPGRTVTVEYEVLVVQSKRNCNRCNEIEVRATKTDFRKV